ncbi:hypothetical protein GQN26_26040 [Escherichia coli]|uniref:hypothetical protein n=1 Tax=Escherichia coli TaxID=562 RepID=UPI001325BD34|nr:hypothetical protein [Escherichia coli]MWP60443.1 hypothetical protein [Escherichia coli]
MNRMMIAALTAAGMLLSVSVTQAAEPPALPKKVDCRKPSEPPKGKDGKPLPPPDSKFKDGKKGSRPVPPPDGCTPPPDGKK